MKRIIVSRLIICASLVWLALWSLVAYRGFTLINDVHQFLRYLPAGKIVPSPVLASLERGQSYVARSFIFGFGGFCILVLVYCVSRRMRNTP